MEESDVSEGREEGDTEEDTTLDPENPEHELAILERDFYKLLTDVEANPEAKQYSYEFVRLYESLYKSREREKYLDNQQNVLEIQIHEKDEKLEAALKLAQTDKETIEELKAEIQRAWKLADAAHAREQVAQEIIDNLRKQVEGLNAEIAFKLKMTESDEQVAETNKNKDDLERQRDKLIYEVGQLQTKLTHAVGYQEELERKNSEADLKINEISGQLEDCQSESDRQKKAKEKLDQDIQQLKIKLEDKDAQNNDLQSIINIHVKQINRQEQELKEQRISYDKIARELDVNILKYSKLQEEFSSISHELNQTKNKLAVKLGELKTLQVDIFHAKTEFYKALKSKEGAEKKMIGLVVEKEEIANDRNALRGRIAVVEKEIEEYKKIADVDKRALDTTLKEKDLLNKSIIKQQAVTKEQEKLIKIQEHSKRKLELELDNLFVEMNKQKKVITSLEHDKDRLDLEQLDLKQNIEEQMEELKQKKSAIFELKKNLYEQQNKFQQQQNLFEAVRADRNSLQKALQESSAEAGELRNKFKIVLHQTEQLKEDIAMKEKFLVKQENIMRKITKEKEDLSIEVNAGLEQIRGLRSDIKEMKEEERRLHKNLLDNERVIRDQAKNLEQLMNERDVIGSQLVRRNDEMALLNEKIKILQITLARGETQYEQRLGDIRLLKVEVKRLRQEKNVWMKSQHNLLDFRQEIIRLERDLTKYRLKCRALEEECQNPMNIHRWRKLEGSDPQVLELIQKIQILQKRLLQQASEAIDRELHLKEAEKLYMNLRQVVSKQPSPEIQEQLLKTQRALKLRNHKLKALVSELNMTELQATGYKSDLDRVTEELNELKKKYIDQKKAYRAKNIQSISSRDIYQARRERDAGDARRTGGGFKMSPNTSVIP